MTALNTELLFAQAYGLNRELIARLQAAAEAESVTLRNHVTDLLIRRAMELPEPRLTKRARVAGAAASYA